MSAALLQARDALRQALAAVDEALGAGAPAVPEHDLLEVPDAARIARVKDCTIRRWVAENHRGEVPDWIGFHLGRQVLLSRSRFEAHLGRLAGGRA